jgi:hypothetical protein
LINILLDYRTRRLWSDILLDKMSSETTATTNGEDNKVTKPRSKWLVRAGFIIFFVVIVGILVAWKVYNSYVNRPVDIDNTTITSQEIKAYAAEVNTYATSHHENFGGTPTQVAVNDLVLNAALKDQAQKHHITLTQADINTALSSKYQAYGSQEAYQAALKALGITNIMKIRDENTAYESILQNTLIANKELLLVGIYYDSPYFSNSNNQAALRAQATQIMKSKYLPLFQKNLSKQAIGQQTTVNTLDPDTTQTNQSQLFFTGMPVTDMYVSNYSAATPYFNESGDNIPGVVSTNQAANSLTKVGQYTKVETFKSGMIGIMRLEGETNGPYNSWSQLLQQYKDKYAKSLAFSQDVHKTLVQYVSDLTKPFASLWHDASLQLFPGVYASTCIAAGGASAHYATFYIRSFDMTTGASLPPAGNASQISGAFVEETRPDASTGSGLACPNVNGTVIDDSNPNVGYTSLNNLVFRDNCWNAAPNWSQNAPSGYTWQPNNDVSRNIQLGSNGWPVWNNGNINSVGNIDLSLAYKPNIIQINPPPPVEGAATLTCFGLQYTPSTQPYNNGKKSYAVYATITLSGATLGGGTTQYGYNTSTNSYSKRGTVSTDVNNNTQIGTIQAGITLTAQAASATITEYYGNGNYLDTLPVSTTPQCYQATCSINSVVGNLPNGEFSPGGSGTATVIVYNNSYSYINSNNQQAQLSIPSSLGSDPLIVQTNYGNSGAFGVPGLPGTNYVTVQVPITAPTSGTSFGISAGVAFANDFWVSPTPPACPGVGGLGGGNIPIYQTPIPTISVACQSDITGTATDPEYPGATISVNIFPNSTGTGTPINPTPIQANGSGQSYSYPVPSSMQNGDDQSFSVIAYDPAGIENSGAVSTSMQGCESFNLAPGANGAALLPSYEAPTSFGFSGTNTDTSVTVTYGSANNPYYGSSTSDPVGTNFPGVPSGASYTYTKNGATVGGGSVPTSNGRFNAPPTANNYAAPNLAIPAGSYTAGDLYCLYTNVNPSNGFIQNDGTVLSINTYQTSSQTSCDTVQNRPFFKVYNGTVSAGGAFQSQSASCSNTDSSGTTHGLIDAWNNDTGQYPTSADYGSSTNLSAFALGKITGLASAQTSFTTTSPPDLLSISNASPGVPPTSTDTYAPNLGGQFNTSGDLCLTDETQAASASAPGTIITDPPATDETIGNITVDNSSNANTRNESIFVNGNVYINGNITYQNPLGDNSVSDLPSFVLHATGNIYVSNNVTQLDGLYVSEGNIYTCGTAYSVLPTSSIFSSCNNQLVVNGSFVANEVKLMRTYGSLRDETPNAGTTTTTGGSTTTTGSLGANAALIWNHSGGVNDNGQAGNYATQGLPCTQINENSEPLTYWQDNYLCLPSVDQGTNGVKLTWISAGQVNNTAWAESTSGMPYCTSDWGDTIDASPWNYPGQTVPNQYYWQDNYLCSNYPVSFLINTSGNPTNANQWCTNVNEPSDTDGHNVWNSGTYVCIASNTQVTTTTSGSTTTTAATPPSIPPCSNQGVTADPSTCAAEIFNFSPELYISSTPAVTPPNNGTWQYDSLTSLPPVL